ncbi:hypothetical protein F5884DRAFT_874258 [Xylogone sp. PMI_703]|nr:hypothetical protein F5884DRAFT_874258 [Xylogone sp. PMI_703]
MLLLIFTLLLRLAVSLPLSISDQQTTNLTTCQANSLQGCVVGSETGGFELCNVVDSELLSSLLISYGEVPNKDCLFYLGLNGAEGQKVASGWYCSKVQGGRGSVVWGTSLPAATLQSYKMLANQFPADLDDPANPSGKRPIFRTWTALHSRALGETCNGVAYFMTPSTSNPGSDPLDNVWWLYEFPALTRNPNILSIIKVDPTLVDEDGSFSDDGHVIWQRGDPPTAQAPGGAGYTMTCAYELPLS